MLDMEKELHLINAASQQTEKKKKKEKLNKPAMEAHILSNNLESILLDYADISEATRE